jgi:2'-5' RNA ligase
MRCVLALLDLVPAKGIDDLRRRFDPLYGIVPAHVTLVFPFDLPMDNESVINHLDAVFASHPPIEVTFGSCQVQQQGYACLPVETGAGKLEQLYERANAGLLAPARLQQRFSGPFLPHLTIGQVNSAASASLIADLASTVHHGLKGTINSVMLETILPDNKSQVEYVIKLVCKQ